MRKQMIDSPVIKNAKASKLETLSVAKIIEAYKKDFDIDVTKYFVGLETISIYQCSACGYRFFYPYTTVSTEDLYDQLKEKHPNYYPKWKWEYEQVLPLFKGREKVLEIGSGNGYFLKKLIDTYNTNVLGIDQNQESIKTANENNITSENVSLEELYENRKEKFDAIVSFQVLEHIPQIESFLNSALQLLKSNGILVVSVPQNTPYLLNNDKYNTLNVPPHHMGLWNSKSLRQMAKFYNLKVTAIIEEPMSQWGYDIERYFEINKDIYFPKFLPFKKLIDKIYLRYLRKTHKSRLGLNVIGVFEKK